MEAADEKEPELTETKFWLSRLNEIPPSHYPGIEILLKHDSLFVGTTVSKGPSCASVELLILRMKAHLCDLMQDQR